MHVQTVVLGTNVERVEIMVVLLEETVVGPDV